MITDNIDFKNELLKSKGSKYLNEDSSLVPVFPIRQVSELEKVIYAVNPLTGLPDSDLSIMNDSRVSPTLRQAIQNANHVIEPNAPSSFDADVLLDANQTPFESKADYYDRLQQEVEDSNKSSDKSQV